MGVVWLRGRSEWRRHRWALVALAVLIGFVGTTVLTAVSGARRTGSSVDRLDETTRALDASVFFVPGESKAAEAVAALPEVEAADRVSSMSFFAEQGQLPLVASVDGHLGDSLLRDRILRGRRPNQSAVDEIGLDEPLARRLGLDVGGRLRLHGVSEQQMACLFSDGSQGDRRCAAIQKGFYSTPPDFSVFAGPPVTLRVVGITRGIFDIAARPGDQGLVFLTSAFYREYHDDVGTQSGVFVRLRPGVTQAEFEAAVKRTVAPEAINESSSTAAAFDGLQSTVGVLANGLLAFAAVAALAGFAAIAQAFARRASAAATERAVLRSLGMGRARLTVDSFAPLVPVAVAGAALSAIGAWLASPLMPVGTARRIEPHPGFRFDAAVFVGGGVLIAVGVVGVAALCGLWATRSSELRTHTARWTRTPVFGGVPATVGWRMAFDRGRGRVGVPLRSAMSGVALGVAGVVAVTTFGAGLNRLGDEPSRYGWAWDMTISGERASDPDAPDPEPKPTSTYWERQAARIAEDPDVAGVTRVWMGFPTSVAGGSVAGFAERRYEGNAGFTIVAGRSPVGREEVALGAKTLRRSHLKVGDRVRVGERSMRVVGQAIFPVTDDGFALADGVLMSAEGFEVLGLGQSSGFGSSGFSTFVVEFRPGADRAAAEARVTAFNRGDPPTYARKGSEVDQLEQLDRLPIVLAVFLLVVALLALGHAIVLTVRYRRPDLAVLRTIGLTPGQTARTVAWQASALAVCGALIGVPIGLVLGKLAWAAVARSYGVADDVAWPVLALALTLPAALVLANALAWWPGRQAARLHPAQILRSE